MKSLTVLVTIFVFLNLKAQEIRSIQLKLKGSKEQISVVPLGSVLELSFDDLEAQEKEYQYKIENMTYDWKPSKLISNQYIDGFQKNYINNIVNSFNTLQAYIHYAVSIPNQNSIITKSGNYRISVLDEDDKVLFSRRCVFFESKVNVGVRVNRSNILNSIDREQNVQAIVNYKGFRINNPDQEIKTVIFQNFNWKTLQYNLSPQFYKPDQLIYSYTNKNNFLAGNQFRNFDTKNIRSTTMNIAKTEMKTIFNSYLYTDTPRRKLPYNYNPDINGQFLLRTLDGNDVNTEGDYSVVHFYLDQEQLQDKKLYVVGQFNNYELSDENEMKFNKTHQLYEGVLKLKQGFYNYAYVALNDNQQVDPTFIDGSFYQTDNNYTVIVYYRPFGGQYDRVIGVSNGTFN